MRDIFMDDETTVTTIGSFSGSITVNGDPIILPISVSLVMETVGVRHRITGGSFTSKTVIEMIPFVIRPPPSTRTIERRYPDCCS